MVGVRKVFEVILVALAAYFAAPLLGPVAAAWTMGLALILGGACILLVERAGHPQPTIDRVMRLIAAAIIVVGVVKVV